MAGSFALSGVRVIDFGQYIAGPLAAMLLADQGADVIRVDPPGGPRYDTPANATWNRGKRSIVLDLKTEDGRSTARKLIASADVVIENFRPGVMDRFGLGAEAMSAENPALIYCSLPGFGRDDPRAGVRAFEGVVGAATGTYRPAPASKTGQPVYTVIPYPSAFAAFLCAVSVAAALNARQRSGLGQRVEIPLHDATYTAFSNHGLKVYNAPKEDKGFEWSRQLPTRDGRWFRYFAGNKKFEHFIGEIGMAKYRDAGASAEELGQRFDEIFRTRTAADWELYCAGLGTEGATCHTSAEWLQHPHALASNIIGEFDDPVIGKFRGPGINVRLSDTPGEVRFPRSLPDAHYAEVMKDLQAPRPAPKAGTPLRTALEGVRVLDLCIILAGPTCGRTLAEFGADVIKIDSPHRNPVSSHNDINRGKRSILLDLKTKKGLEIFWKLVDQADVVLQNFRKGVAGQLGIGYEALKARKPGIIFCSLNTFGQLGPYAERPGHESIGQAISGMMERFGSDKPALAPFAGNDYGTGLMGAYAVALALLHRQRTGQGQHVDTALAYTATMLQSGLLQGTSGKQWNEPRGQECLGHGPLNRMYKAGDAWLYLAGRAEQLRACTALADLAGKSGTELEKALVQRIATRKAEEWVKDLNAAGFGAHRVVTDFDELMDSPLAKARGLSVTREHDVIGPVRTSGPGPRLSGTPLSAGRPASKPGSDAASVLKEIGMDRELERLMREKVIVMDGIAAG